MGDNSVTEEFPVTASDGKAYDVLQNSGKVTALMARDFAGSEFEKYRIIQDRLFESDFDKEIKHVEGKHNRPDN